MLRFLKSWGFFSHHFLSQFLCPVWVSTPTPSRRTGGCRSRRCFAAEPVPGSGASATRRAQPDRAAVRHAPPAQPPAHVVRELPRRRVAVVAGRPSQRAQDAVVAGRPAPVYCISREKSSALTGNPFFRNQPY